MAYADLEDVKSVGEELVTFVVGRVLENRREELKVLERDITKLEAIQAPFHRMSYDDAVKKLQSKGSEIQWGGDFGNTDETLLTDDLDRPVMVDRYPTEVKAFYFQPAEDRPEVALGVDFIAPEGYGEIIGGGQRIHDLDLFLTAPRRTSICRARRSIGTGSAQVRLGSARRIWNGRRTLRRVDVRAGAHSRNHRIPANAVSHAAVDSDNREHDNRAWHRSS